MKKAKKKRARMTDREVTETALAMIKIEQKRFNLPDHFKKWLAGRRAALEKKLADSL